MPHDELSPWAKEMRRHGGPAVGSSFLDNLTGFASSDFDANMAAIVEYFNREKPANDAARKIKDEFATWNAGLGWWEKTDLKRDETLTKARNFVTRYRAAADVKYLSPEKVEERQTYGVSLEKAQGKPEKAKTSSGMLAEPPPEVPPLIPLKYKIAGAAGVAILAALAILKRI